VAKTEIVLAGELDRGAGIEGDCATPGFRCDPACAQHPHPGDGVDSDRFDMGEGRAAAGPEERGVGQGELFGVRRERSPDLVCEVGHSGGGSSRWRITGFGRVFARDSALLIFRTRVTWVGHLARRRALQSERLFIAAVMRDHSPSLVDINLPTSKVDDR